MEVNDLTEEQQAIIDRTTAIMEAEKEKTEQPKEAEGGVVDTIEQEVKEPTAEEIDKVELPKEEVDKIESLTASQILELEDASETKIKIGNEEGEELSKTKRELAEIKAQLEDESVKITLKIAKDAKAAGKSVPEFLAGLKGEDVGKLSPLQLFERQLDGLEGLSEDGRKRALESFEGLDEWEQLEKTKGIKKELTDSQKRVFEQYSIKSIENEEKQYLHP